MDPKIIVPEVNLPNLLSLRQCNMILRFPFPISFHSSSVGMSAICIANFEVSIHLHKSFSELTFTPSNCLCTSTAVACMNSTSIPKGPPQMTSLFLIGNRLQLTVDSFTELNLTQNLYVFCCLPS